MQERHVSSSDRASDNGIKMPPEVASDSKTTTHRILSLESRCGESQISSVLCSVHILILLSELCL